jgi:hypothetical protein
MAGYMESEHKGGMHRVGGGRETAKSGVFRPGRGKSRVMEKQGRGRV